MPSAARSNAPSRCLLHVSANNPCKALCPYEPTSSPIQKALTAIEVHS